MIHNKATTFPMEQFDAVARAIIKHIDTTVRRVEVITTYELT